MVFDLAAPCPVNHRSLGSGAAPAPRKARCFQVDRASPPRPAPGWSTLRGSRNVARRTECGMAGPQDGSLYCPSQYPVPQREVLDLTTEGVTGFPRLAWEETPGGQHEGGLGLSQDVLEPKACGRAPLPGPHTHSRYQALELWSAPSSSPSSLSQEPCPGSCRRVLPRLPPICPPDIPGHPSHLPAAFQL